MKTILTETHTYTANHAYLHTRGASADDRGRGLRCAIRPVRAHTPQATARGVSLEHIFPLDLKSELASEDSAVLADDGKDPTDKLLRDSVDALNKFVDSRRFQLSQT